MNAKKFIIITIVLFIFILLGCEEMVLDKSPKTVLTENEVWNDKNLVQKYLFSAYNSLPTVWGISDYNTNWNGAIQMLTSACDEGFSHNNSDKLWFYNQGNIDSENMGGPWRMQWAGRYNDIKDCNILLNRIEEVEMDEAQRNCWKGEIKFLRAYSYAYLIDYWGGVPIITKAFDLNDDFEEYRNSYEECVDFIIKELDEAKEMVPEVWATEYWGRITKGACAALKSRVLLRSASKLHDPGTEPNGPLYDYNKANKWQDAANAAKDVIDMQQFSLEQVDTWQDYTKIFTERNSEIILATPRSSEYFAVGNRYALMQPDYINLPSGFYSWSTNCPSQNIVDVFQMDNGKMIDEEGSGYNDSTENIYKNREMRFYANIFYNGCEYQGRKIEYWLPGGRDSKEGIQGWDYGMTGYNMRKFCDESYVLPNYSRTGTQPRIHFRLAEFYLNYAEAEYQLGNEDIAREYVNKIRRRVKLPDIITSGEELFKDIMHERRIELCFEDQRFFDVKRWMIADQTDNKDIYGIEWKKFDEDGNLSSTGTLHYNLIHVQKRYFHDRMYYLPIPLSEIEKSNLLEQNSGYSF